MPTHAYTIEGKRVPSVTSILGEFKNPSGLMYWAWQKANDVLLEAHSLIDRNGDSPDVADYLRRRQAYLNSRPLERANFRKESQDACDAGTLAHQIVSEWIALPKEEQSADYFKNIDVRRLMCNSKVTREIAIAALNGINAFRDWIEQNKFELVKTEIPLISRKFQFGGCIDCVGHLRNKLVLFDWKTSSAVYVDYLAQIAGYCILWEESYPTEPIEASHLIRFDKTTADFAEHRFTDMTDPKDFFLHLRAAYALLKSLEKRVK